MKKISIKNRGFSLIETVVVLAVFAALLGLVMINILNSRSSTAINTSLSLLITDIKNQQTKAMLGDTEGRGVPDNYGVYVAPTQYTLFHGQTYSSSDSVNFNVKAENGFSFSTTFPNNQVIFASSSGEIVNFVPGQDTISAVEIRTGQQKTIQLNKYGVITSLN